MTSTSPDAVTTPAHSLLPLRRPGEGGQDRPFSSEERALARPSGLANQDPPRRGGGLPQLHACPASPTDEDLTSTTAAPWSREEQRVGASEHQPRSGRRAAPRANSPVKGPGAHLRHVHPLGHVTFSPSLANASAHNFSRFSCSEVCSKWQCTNFVRTYKVCKEITSCS